MGCDGREEVVRELRGAIHDHSESGQAFLPRVLAGSGPRKDFVVSYVNMNSRHLRWICKLK